MILVTKPIIDVFRELYHCCNRKLIIFQGYSFVSPSVIFSNNNVIGEECLADDFQALVSVSPFFSKYKLIRTEAGFLGRGSFSVCRFFFLFFAQVLRYLQCFQVAKIRSQKFAFHIKLSCLHIIVKLLSYCELCNFEDLMLLAIAIYAHIFTL